MTESSSILPQRLSGRTVLLRLALSVLPLALFVWVLEKYKLPLLPSAEARSHASASGVVLYGFWVLALFILRGIRWRWLVGAFTPISTGLSVILTSIGNMAIVLLPLRAGEFVRPLIAKRYGISSLAVASTIGAERIIDGWCVGALVAVSLSLAPGHPEGLEILPAAFRDPTLVTRVARLALIGFTLAMVGLGVLYFNSARVSRLLEQRILRLWPRLAQVTAERLSAFTSGLSFLRNGKPTFIYVAVTIGYWILHAVGMHLLLHACGFPDARLVESAAITGVFALGFLLPSPPGFFGAFQTTLYAGLLLYFPVARVVREGSSVVFFAYSMQLGQTLLLGLGCYIIELLRARPRSN